MAEVNGLSRSHTAPNGSSRHEKSLGLLTIKFVTLLQESENGVLDLKVAADTLAVRQKRRIYDITNVLEGIGLIEKKTKNTIQWKGESSGCQPQEILEQVELLKAQISELERQEKELDIQKEFLQQSNKHLKEDPNSIRYSYVTHEDICNVFSGDTLLAVMAPAGTQLEVPVPEMAQNGQKRYQVNLRSQSSPIQVMLINRETGSSKPVVFSVPPPDDIYTMPTPPSTPASQQRFPIPSDPCSMGHTQLKSPASEHQLTPSSTPPDIHMECQPESPVSQCLLIQEPLVGTEAVVQSHGELDRQDVQSILDVGSLLRLNTVDQMKEEKEGVADLIDELMSSDVFPLLRLSPNPGVDYNFNLDDNEGVCDLFDVQILNY
ncbi:transcription factor E2F5 [Electrophorus electricus]|uniref:transcription factor E2F5 n=1 Tax=Electrophorus electricus TaxID=8005 RepID=UPI0015D0B9AF|nr:transcription factor E2F5 [Electrophorus electricus]